MITLLEPEGGSEGVYSWVSPAVAGWSLLKKKTGGEGGGQREEKETTGYHKKQVNKGRDQEEVMVRGLYLGQNKRECLKWVWEGLVLIRNPRNQKGAHPDCGERVPMPSKKKKINCQPATRKGGGGPSKKEVKGRKKTAFRARQRRPLSGGNGALYPLKIQNPEPGQTDPSHILPYR